MLRMNVDRRRQESPSSSKMDRRRLQIPLRRLPSVSGVGVDCEKVSRFENMDRKLMEKMYTKKEIDYCSRKANPSQHFAARFAAKEAVIKCFGSMGKRIFMNQIEILNRKNGSPYVRILDKNLKMHGVKISLSHSNGMAIAFAAVAGGGRNG